LSSGSSRSIVLPSSSVTTTVFVQVFSVVRVNTSTTGVFAGTVIEPGSKPFGVTRIFNAR
jgi:hypothetical protein